MNLAVEEYVAPRSLTLDVKTLLMGHPKMDTNAVGDTLITIKSRQSLFYATLKCLSVHLSILFIGSLSLIIL